MRKYRKLLISVLLVAAVGAAVWYFYDRRRNSPATVQMLPEGDLLLYADLRPLHLLLKQPNAPQLEHDYQQFVEQTGIQFERDLDEVAMSRRDTADGRDVESAEIFVGRFDSARLKDYLRRNSAPTETYRDLMIYAIPNEGHTVRACLLDGSRVAVTNMASADAMRGIIDRLHESRPASSLLADYYKRVPLGSLAWMIDRIPANSDAPQLPGGLNFGFLENTVAVVSLRYNGALLVRADVVARSEADAHRLLDSANVLLVMYRSISGSLGAKGSDPDVKAALNSIRVEQEADTAIFTAEFSERFLKKILSETQLDGQAVAPPPSPVPSPRSQPKARGKK
ncbi:MAG TPA: hypothetical protein VI488_17035 [Candidatus Angelobacter sp.]